MSLPPAPPRLLKAAIRSGRVRTLRLEVDLEFDGRIALPDGYIVSALADGLLELDRQEALFPGAAWPRHLERLRDWSVRLAGSGGRCRPLTPLEIAIEQRRREGHLGPQATPANAAAERLREDADTLLAAIDDLEPQMMERAEAAWAAIVQLRQVAARLEMPETSSVQLRGAIEEARALVAAAR